MQRLVLGFLMFSLLSCSGRNRKSDENDDTTIRSGEDVPIENQKFYDARPSISADGERLTFISGRSGSLRVFKFKVGDEKPSRLTSSRDNLQDEFEAVISPNGALVGFIGSQKNTINIHIKKYDGMDEINTVSDEDNAVESQLSFSDDGSLITFVRRSESQQGAKIYVAEVSAEGEVSNVTRLSDVDSDEYSPKFISTSVPGIYKILSIKRNHSDFGYKYWLRTLSVAGGIQVDEEVELENMRPIKRDAPFSTGLDTIYFSTNADESGEFASRAWVPKGKVRSTDTFAVQSVMAAYDVEKRSIAKIGNNLGVSVLSASSSKESNGVLLGLTQDVWSCTPDKFTYVTRLKVINPATEKVASITPLYNKESKFKGVAETLCVDSSEKIEGSINTAIVNADGTPKNYSVVYVSLFPKGDNEVRLLTYDGKDYFVTDVSQNTN